MISVYWLLGLFAIKHFLSSYPLQTAYSSQGLGQDNWVWPMAARAAVHGVLTGVLAMAYWSLNGRQINPQLLCLVTLGDFTAHFFIDRLKVSKDFLGNFQVASAEDLAQCRVDYTSKDPAVVKAAQDLSDSNKYFWWADGFCHLLYAGAGIYIASLIA